jgi:hypothetical protein
MIPHCIRSTRSLGFGRIRDVVLKQKGKSSSPQLFKDATVFSHPMGRELNPNSPLQRLR